MGGATNGARFLSYVADALVPALTPVDAVVMDNLAAHEAPGIRSAMEAAGSHPRCRLASSPDFNRIDSAFAKPRAPLWSAAARSVHDL
ncbi:hypothetical protein D3273_05250 [Lichenibacterium minor]|uniref:Tc1-like transposase DDE domain-containing protein n=1 Tax=Lichenibacterium minor TaxID=2316528 RepID=A0A4Q2UDA2_9HYPH|nr:hypothetical protein [Lichenibacterium minor]RYC33271.1 hypothetical protein D3273_05250 [Lichenibacterium minor]